MEPKDLPLYNLIRMRQHIKGVLTAIDVFLSTFEPLCRRCFYSKALIDKCECGQKGLDKENKTG